MVSSSSSSLLHSSSSSSPPHSPTVGQTPSCSSKSSWSSSHVDPSPEDSEARDDLQQISLCEASFGFVNLFRRPKELSINSNNSVSSQQSQNSDSDEEIPYKMEGYGGTTLVFRRVEKPGFWLMAVVPPTSSPDDGVNPFVVYQLLGNLHTSFQRQNGTLKHLSIGGETSSQVRLRLRKKCQLFFEWFLPHIDVIMPNFTMSLPSPTPFSIFGGRTEGLMKWLSLDRLSFMSVQSFVNHCKFSCSPTPNMGIMFLYNDNLVVSTINLMPTRVLYSYVTTHVIPEAVSDEMSRGKRRNDHTSYWWSDGKPTLLYLPKRVGSSSFDGDAPSPVEEFSTKPSTLEPEIEWAKSDNYFYRSLNGSTLVVVFPSLDSSQPSSSSSSSESLRKELLDSIDIYSRQHLFNLTSIVSKQSVNVVKTASMSTTASTDRHLYFHQQLTTSSLATVSDPDSGISYLYYNEANAALKTFFPTTVGHSLTRQSASAPSLLHHQTSPSTMLQHIRIGGGGNDAFSQWTGLESDLRFILLKKPNNSSPSSQTSTPEKEDLPRNPPNLEGVEDQKAIPREEKDSNDNSPSKSPNHMSKQSRKRRIKRAEGGLEILAKADADESWVIVKRSDGRSLYATLSNHKNLNLEEVAGLINQRSPSSSGGGSSSGKNPTAAFFAPFASLFQ